MRKGFQKAGKQPTKFEIDCGVVANLIKQDKMPQAIDYCMENNIDEKTFAQITLKVEKEQNKQDYYAVICTFNDGSKCFYKGNRAISYNEKVNTIDKNMLYSSLAIAKKAKQSFEAKRTELEKEFEVQQLVIQ